MDIKPGTTRSQFVYFSRCGEQRFAVRSNFLYSAELAATRPDEFVEVVMASEFDRIVPVIPKGFHWRRVFCWLGFHDTQIGVTKEGRRQGFKPILHSNCPYCGVYLLRNS